jgi:hypothetical protein
LISKSRNRPGNRAFEQIHYPPYFRYVTYDPSPPYHSLGK